MHWFPKLKKQKNEQFVMIWHLVTHDKKGYLRKLGSLYVFGSRIATPYCTGTYYKVDNSRYDPSILHKARGIDFGLNGFFSQ